MTCLPRLRKTRSGPAHWSVCFASITQLWEYRKSARCVYAVGCIHTPSTLYQRPSKKATALLDSCPYILSSACPLNWLPRGVVQITLVDTRQSEFSFHSESYRRGR